jgi:adenine-specific DNA methylase
MIERDFDVPFVADLALREKQIQQNYRPIMAVHKWFARRPGTLFRALILSEAVRHPTNVFVCRVCGEIYDSPSPKQASTCPQTSVISGPSSISGFHCSGIWGQAN